MPFLKNAPILVTGGAGFIGANFVLDWVEIEQTPVIILDKLTYAGNIENLSSLKNNLLYKATDFYAPQFECILAWNDPKIAIDWPHDTPPVLSEKDAQGLMFDRIDTFA